MKLIEYIGPKPSKTDNVAGTNVTWNGTGDVQEVPDKAAPLLLAHPNVWRLSDESDPLYVAKIGDGASKQIINLGLIETDQDLRAFIKEHKISGVKPGLRGDNLRAAIIAAVEVRG